MKKGHKNDPGQCALPTGAGDISLPEACEKTRLLSVRQRTELLDRLGQYCLVAVMHFADGVTEVTHMENLRNPTASSRAPWSLRPAIPRRPDQEPIDFGTFKYEHIAPCADRSVLLQAARGDDDLMSMDPNLTQA
jgi:hypothetical protein